MTKPRSKAQTTSKNLQQYYKLNSLIKKVLTADAFTVSNPTK